MGNLQELKKRAEAKAKEQADLRHRYRMENHKHYRAWYNLDKQLNEWRAKTDNIMHKNILGSLLEYAILLFAEIEMSPHPNSDNIGFDVILEMNIQKDKDIGRLNDSLFKAGEQIREQADELEKLKKQIEIQKKEIAYYESEEKK